MYYRGAQAAIVVYDITNQVSLIEGGKTYCHLFLLGTLLQFTCPDNFHEYILSSLNCKLIKMISRMALLYCFVHVHVYLFPSLFSVCVCVGGGERGGIYPFNPHSSEWVQYGYSTCLHSHFDRCMHCEMRTCRF